MVLIIDCGSSKVPDIEYVVSEYEDYQTVKIDDLKNINFSLYNGIIISGAPILLTEIDFQFYLTEFSFIKEIKIPILGICFGHQIIGLVYGAKVSRQKEARDWQVIEQIGEDIIFDKLPLEFEMMEDHCECISVPKDFDLIAVSDDCINEGMKHINKKIYGVQFHPEVSGNTGSLLIDNFIKICTTNY